MDQYQFYIATGIISHLCIQGPSCPPVSDHPSYQSSSGSTPVEFQKIHPSLIWQDCYWRVQYVLKWRRRHHERGERWSARRFLQPDTWTVDRIPHTCNIQWNHHDKTVFFVIFMSLSKDQLLVRTYTMKSVHCRYRNTIVMCHLHGEYPTFAMYDWKKDL